MQSPHHVVLFFCLVRGVGEYVQRREKYLSNANKNEKDRKYEKKNEENKGGKKNICGAIESVWMSLFFFFVNTITPVHKLRCSKDHVINL